MTPGVPGEAGRGFGAGDEQEFNDLGDRDKALPMPRTGSCFVNLLGHTRQNVFFFSPLNNLIYSIISNRSHLPAVC